MADEVSVSLKIGIIVVMLAAFLSAMLNIAIQSDRMMGTIMNKSADTTQAVSVSDIFTLQKNPRNYVEIYKVYANYGGYINSVTGKDLDGTTHIHYCRNSSIVQSGNPVSVVLDGNTYTNFDNMDTEYLRDFCKDQLSGTKLRVYIYASNADQQYDIYYEVLDR